MSVGKKEKINVLSLFDGMSCGQIALNKVGIEYENYFASEIDKYAMQVTQKNYPNTKQLGSVTELDGTTLPKIDLMYGGSPCQDLSSSNVWTEQKGLEGKKSSLFWEFVRLLKEVKPTYFLLENVGSAKNSDIETLLYEYHYNAVAYDFYFTLHIATRTFSDATIIIEQIAPMFRPDLSVKIFELDLQEEPTTVPIRLGDFDVTLPELDPDEIRIIEVSVPLTVQGNLYLPIKEEGIVTNMTINSRIAYGDKTLKEASYDIDNNGLVNDNIGMVIEITKGAATPDSKENAIVTVRNTDG
jgi:hypothetical protein